MENTGANVTTICMENGEHIYPCRCGTIHHGDYGLYDYGHHNCLHEANLIGLAAGHHIQAICPICGMSWIVEMRETGNGACQPRPGGEK